MKKSNIEVKGTTISYSFQGQEDPLIVFLHGNSLSSSSFQAQFDDGGLQNFSLLAIDFPGHGKSARAMNPSNTYNLFYFRDVVLELLKKLGITSFVFAGHSLGGHVAMECLPYSPGCHGIFLWGAPPVKLPLNINELFNPVPEAGLLFSGVLSSADIDALTSILGCEFHQQAIAKMIASSDPAFRENLPHSFRSGKVSDEYKLLIQANVPVAIVQGEHDRLINSTYLKGLELPSLWQDKVIVLKNACHSPQMEIPLSFNKLIKEFTEHCYKR